MSGIGKCDQMDFPELSQEDLATLRAQGMTDEEIEAGLAVIEFARLPREVQRGEVPWRPDDKSEDSNV